MIPQADLAQMYTGGPPAPRNGPLTRKEFRAVHAAIRRANAPGKDARIADAQRKRDRRMAKRAAEVILNPQTEYNR